MMNRINTFRMAALALSATPAFGWGCVGHRTVALIALQQLTPNARAMASRLLQGEPSDPTLHPFCGASGLVPFADMSTWADDIRQRRKDTAPWHFIDIPLGGSRDRMTDDCPAATGCVTSAIRRNLDLLRSPSAGEKEKTEALMFVIHLVGDLHQPLHAAANNDRGGNCVPVVFFGDQPAPGASGSYHPNLHGVWDTELVERIDRKREPAEFADALSVEFAAEIDSWKKQPLDLESWAWQSHVLAVEVAYGGLPREIHAEKPHPVESCADDNQVGERMYRLHEKIDKRYLHEVSPVIRRQLARAGTHLAMVLNQLWP
jgi:nuclease S1